MTAYRFNYPQLYEPILAPLLANQPTVLMITVACLSHGVALSVGLPGWSCPVYQTLGIPCPGCGLSRGMKAFVMGDWQTALTFHAFAPIFLVALGLIFIINFLPSSPRNWLIHSIKQLEHYTGVTAILLIALVFYWLARLLLFREAFINLISGS